MDDQLKLFLKSIKEVSPRYIRYKEDVLQIEKQNNDEKYKEHVERVFAYELYHRWSNKLHNLPKKKKQGLMINAELTKSRKICFDGLKNENDGINIHQEHDKFYPDLVLHRGQDDYTGHEIICEIKKYSNSNNDEFTKDLERLIKMTLIRPDDSQFKPYNYGIMLVFGEKDGDWVKMKKPINNINDELLKKLREGKVFIYNAFIISDKNKNDHVSVNTEDLYKIVFK